MININKMLSVRAFQTFIMNISNVLNSQRSKMFF